MKKSIVISLLAIAILFGTAICSISSTGIVTTDTLRLRKEPSTNATILELLSMDDKVSILEEEEGWYKVKAEVDSKEYVGYVAMQYIKVQEPTSEETEAQGKENDTQEEQPAVEENTEKEETVLVKVVNSNVNIYIVPLINALVIDTTDQEEKVEIISEVKNWSYIKTENTEGWVRTENIIEKEEKVSDSEKNKTSSQKTGYISANSVNFRKEAKNDGFVITTLKLNDQVKILEKGTTWTKVQYAGNVGYIATKYISENKVTTTSRSSSTRTTKKSNSTETTKNTEKAQETKTTSETAKTENAVETKNTSSVKGTDIVAFAKKYLQAKDSTVQDLQHTCINILDTLYHVHHQHKQKMVKLLANQNYKLET